MSYKCKRMPSACYEGAPELFREKVAFVCSNGCKNGLPFDILLVEGDGHGNAVGVDMGERTIGQHFFLNPSECRNYRATNYRKRKSWAELPNGMRKTIVGYLESE